MTILARGGRQDGTESGGLRPPIRVAMQAHDAFMHALTGGRASRAETGRAQEFDRSSDLIEEIDSQVDVSRMPGRQAVGMGC